MAQVHGPGGELYIFKYVFTGLFNPTEQYFEFTKFARLLYNIHTIIRNIHLGG